MLRTLSITLAMALVAAGYSADSASDFKKFMLATLPKIKRAFEKKDISYFEKISTPDFTEFMDGREYGKKESMTQMKAMFQQTKSMTAKLKLDSVKVEGNKFIAMTTGRFVAILKPAKKGDKEHKLVIDLWEKETWVRSGKSYKILRLEHTKPMQTTMDGKPFDPSSLLGG